MLPLQILSNGNFASALSNAVVFAEQTLVKTGFEACYLLSGDARQAKRTLCALEEESPLGRLRRAAVEVLEREAYITLKPGLVDERNCGSHPDMRLAMLLTLFGVHYRRPYLRGGTVLAPVYRGNTPPSAIAPYRPSGRTDGGAPQAA